MEPQNEGAVTMEAVNVQELKAYFFGGLTLPEETLENEQVSEAA